MNIHEQIKDLLDKGETVHSYALGRVGKVISVHNASPLGFDVEVCHRYLVKSHRHTHGVTTFLRGDPVKLIKEKNGYAVLNAGWIK